MIFLIIYQLNISNIREFIVKVPVDCEPALFFHLKLQLLKIVFEAFAARKLYGLARFDGDCFTRRRVAP